MNPAELIIKMLEEQGVEYLFGIPGGAIEDLNTALYHSSRIEPIITKHEEGAAFIADGYARVSGRLGVCCSTAGPGATNLITGLATSYADRIPVQALTGQVATSVFGKGAIQESGSDGINIVSIFRNFTRYSGMLLNEKRTPHIVQKAIHKALSCPGGPVHLNLPADIMKKTVGAIQPPRLSMKPAPLTANRSGRRQGYSSAPKSPPSSQDGGWSCPGRPGSSWNLRNSSIFRWRPPPRPRGFFPNPIPFP